VNRIDLLHTPDVPRALLAEAAPAIERAFGGPCRVRPEPVSFGVAPDPARNQYYATAILQAMLNLDGLPGRVLAVTGIDLFVPVLTFVFGEAQLPGRCAVVSIHRLQDEFYGLPPNASALRERLLKEAVHELGHTYGLLHCDDWECVMSSSHGVERLDVKSAQFCAACLGQVRSPGVRQPLRNLLFGRTHRA
jgi:archaemetzincin